MIWDDHDIIEGWGSLLGPTELDRRLFWAASTAYREYHPLRIVGADVDAAPPYHYSFWYGDVGFFVLDLRGERNYRAGRVIGERQWQDLDEFVRTAAQHGIPTVFVVSSIPLVHLPPAFDHLLEWVPGARGTDIRDRWAVWPTGASATDCWSASSFGWSRTRDGRRSSSPATSTPARRSRSAVRASLAGSRSGRAAP